jgi:hypothetical protein
MQVCGMKSNTPTDRRIPDMIKPNGGFSATLVMLGECKCRPCLEYTTVQLCTMHATLSHLAVTDAEHWHTVADKTIVPVHDVVWYSH